MKYFNYLSAPLPSYLGDGFFTTYKQFDWTVPRHKLVWVVMNGKAMTRNHDAIKRSLYLKIHGKTYLKFTGIQ